MYDLGSGFHSPALQSKREWPTEDGPHVGLSYDQPISHSSAFKPFECNKTQKRTQFGTGALHDNTELTFLLCLIVLDRTQ